MPTTTTNLFQRMLYLPRAIADILSKEVYELPGLYVLLARHLTKNQGNHVEARDRAAATAAAILEFRRIRSELLPRELFAEPGWDLLLELFVADASGHRLTARDVSDRNNIPPSVLSRWLIHLTHIGFVVGDGNGNLDDLLTLSGKALDVIEDAMAKADELREAVE